MEEIWKDIKNYEGLYQVSSQGRVKSLNYNKTRKEKIIIPVIIGGYYRVTLCKNGKYKYYFVHRLVYETFVGEIPEGMQVNHLDEKPNNNRLENLNLLTPKANANWGTRNEKIKIKLSKPVLQFDLNGKFIKEWPSMSEVKRQLGFLNSSISSCCKNIPYYKTAYGYIWKFKEAV